MNTQMAEFLNTMNRQNAAANQLGSQYNQNTPFGNLNFQQTSTGPGGVPIYTANQGLTENGQAMLDNFQHNQSTFGSLAPEGAAQAYNTASAAGSNLGAYMGYLPGALATTQQAQGMLGPASSSMGQAAGMIPGASDMVSQAAGMIPQAQGTVQSGIDQMQSLFANMIPGVEGLTPDILAQLSGYRGVDPSQVIGDSTTGNTRNLVNHMIEYYDPYFEQQRASTDNRLRNQGFSPSATAGGSNPGYDNAMQNVLKAQNAEVGKSIAQFEPIAYAQAYQNFMTPLALGTGMSNIQSQMGSTTAQLSSAVNQMVSAGKTQAEIAQTLAQMGVSQAQIAGVLGNIGQQQGGLASIMGNIGQTQGGLAGVGGNLVNSQNSLADILSRSALSNLAASNPTMPTWINPPALNIPGVNANPANLVGATANAQQAQLNAFNAQNQQNSNFLSGVSGIASAIPGLVGLSDRRLKENIVQIGVLPNTLPVYSYNFIGNDKPQIGLMADEVALIHPEAVVEVSGYKAVNYTMAVR
jgi:hypothetical protein